MFTTTSVLLYLISWLNKSILLLLLLLPDKILLLVYYTVEKELDFESLTSVSLSIENIVKS